MNDDWLADRFEEHRSHLKAVAYRLLGSLAEADDAVQDAWMRMQQSGVAGVENLGGWMTTVVGRVCLNMLQSRRSKREEPFGSRDDPVGAEGGVDPEHEALVADSVGVAMLVVLDTLSPAERLAFVLHDVFAVPFDEIALVVDRTPDAARQLASRARRRVRGTTTVPDADLAAKRDLVDAFLAAARNGEFEALLTMLDPDVALRGDRVIVRMGGPSAVDGARAVAGIFSGRAQGTRPAVVDGTPGAVWAPRGRPRIVFRFATSGGRISEIDLVAEPALLSRIDLVPLDD